MGMQNEEKILSTLYGQLYDILKAQLGQGSGSSQQPFVHFSKNEAINPEDFKNARSSVNPSGRLETAQSFSLMVDKIPLEVIDWAPTASSLDQVYGLIVENATSVATPDPDVVKQYKDAQAVLQIVDQGGTVIDSPAYAKYKALKTVYQDKEMIYNREKGKQNTPEQIKNWLSQEPILQNAMDTAYTEWRTANAAVIEQNLAIVQAGIGGNVAQSAFLQARKAYKQGEFVGLDGQPWHLSFALPSNWAETENYLTTLEVSSRFLENDTNPDFIKYRGDDFIKNGLWRIEGQGLRGGAPPNELATSMEAQSFSLTAKIGLVRISRPWLHMPVFQLKNWALNGFNPGDISDGRIDSTQVERNLLPLIPTSFFVIKDAVLEGEFSAGDEKIITEALSGGKELRWGPIALSGVSSHGLTPQPFSSTYSQGRLSIPNLQILGWVSEIVPFSPPKAIQ